MTRCTTLSPVIVLLAAYLAACSPEPAGPALALAEDPSAHHFPEHPGGQRGDEVFAPGVISDDREQYRITFTPSGDTAYFAAGDGFFPMTREATIYESVRVAGEWQTPVPASFSGVHPDIDPFIPPSGDRLYFSSIRPVDGEPREVADLWKVERVGTGWGEPERIPASSDRDDLYPSVDRWGNLYYATPGQHADLGDSWNVWVARRVAGGRAAPEPVAGGVNTADTWDFNPAISWDGRRLVFTRLDPANAVDTGFGELHVSFQHRGVWTPARNIGAPVNTPQDEYHASFSPDERTLYFVRRDPFAEGANGDIHRIPVSALGPTLRPGGSLGGSK